MRVLHVSGAMGGGIVSSVLAMVEATPEIDHHLLAHSHHGHDTGDDLAKHFSSVHVLPDNPAQAMLALRRTCRQIFPDVVHAHSSSGGVLVRLAGLDRPKVVYSPHCFAFERRDITGTQRRFFEKVERMLASRTDLLIAVAPWEIDLAAALGHHEIAYAPNRTIMTETARAHHAAPLKIVAAGRICAQKDWRYLLHVKRFAESEYGLDAQWEWLGGGELEGEHALEEDGVRVSGWIPRDELLARMASAQVYLHTAAWEAAPMSILEAAELGVPLAIRAISPLDSLDLPGLSFSVKDLSKRVASLSDDATWTLAQQQSDALAKRHSRTAQGRRLRNAYDRVCNPSSGGSSGEVGPPPIVTFPVRPIRAQLAGSAVSLLPGPRLPPVSALPW